MAVTMRVAASGVGWSEVFLSSPEASNTQGAAESLVLGHSLVLLHDLSTLVECEALRSEASLSASAERTSSLSPYFTPEKIRMPIAERLGEEGQALCDKLLVRTFERMQECFPSGLVEALFGEGCLEPSTCLHNPRLSFSIGEPAVNVYQTGGLFKPHTDNFSLSILVPLNTSTGPHAAFTGGGTAFWSVEDWQCMRKMYSADDHQRTETPTLSLAPNSGTALLFIGSVMHSGLPVTAGERCILVTSLSSMTGADNGFEREARGVGGARGESSCCS